MASPEVMRKEAAVRRPNTRAQPRLSKALREKAILDGILAGKTEEQIGRELGKSKSAVERVVIKKLEETENAERASIEHVREIQLRRIDELLTRLWPLAMGLDDDGEPTKEPHMGAIDRIGKLEAQRARIAGTEAARKVEHSGEIGFHIDREEQDEQEAIWAASGGDVVDGTAVEVAELPSGG